MANNPIQVILNTQNYVKRSENVPGGSIKDFYSGRNDDFLRHRETLENQLNELQNAFSGHPPDDIFYARIDLQADAWAKSHRPIQKIFPSRNQAYVGGAELGSMIVELTPADIPRISSAVVSAEVNVIEVEKNGKLVPKPSKARSEVGAIKSVRSYSQADRRKFSAEQAFRWLSDPRTGGAYYVETFVSWDNVNDRVSDKLKARGVQALSKFEAGLQALDLQLDILWGNSDLIPSSIYILKIRTANMEAPDILAAHNSLLEFLDHQAVIKAVHLPPVLQTARMGSETSVALEIPPPIQGATYPVVGIIDTGVCQLPALNAWGIGSSEYLSDPRQDFSHGTFIAGLVCAADILNTGRMFTESKCHFFDLGLHPTTDEAYGNYYPRGFLDFLEQLDAEIPTAKEAGARIYNMSLSVTTPVADDSYSLFANILDEIADRHDVIFILPSGNLDPSRARDEWSTDANNALAMLAAYRFSGQDRIFQPADSIRSLVVGAMDPETPEGNLFPSRYSRRGPGPSLGAKPDLAHIGGKLDDNSGLYSLSISGDALQSCGTSYAAPLVAKTVAAIDHAIEGSITREALMALVIHHAKRPPCIESPILRHVARDFVGAGIPRQASETLLVEDYEITLVFNGVLSNGHELGFQFAWPNSLVNDNGGCSGNVNLTLVYRPPTDRSFGGEFIRINLDAYLRQETIDPITGKSTFKGRLKGDGAKIMEKEMVKHGAKWWPVKRLSNAFNSVGKSSQWRLVIKPLARTEFVIPEEGIPFSVILTISDPDRVAPIFNEMRLQLRGCK
jgi:hypothetical protein